MIFVILFFICLSILVYKRYLNNYHLSKPLEKFNNINTDIIELNNVLCNKNKKCNERNERLNSIDKLLLKCFNDSELHKFKKKYDNYSSKIVYRDSDSKMIKGVVVITPSKYISELPQITLNGYFINNLCVDPKYRRNGIAKELITYLINKAKKEEKMHLILQVFKDKKLNTNSDYLIDFYLDMGFKQYLNNESMVIMIHSL